MASLLVGCDGGGMDPRGSGFLPGPTELSSAGPSTESPAAIAIPRTIGPADDGRAFTMKVGQTAELVVPDPHAADPSVEGDSVEVIAVLNLTGSGQREWELRAVAPGRTTLAGSGSHKYVITVDVAPP